MEKNKHVIIAEQLTFIEENIMRFHEVCMEKQKKGFLTKPHFIGVGAGRCGTSAIYSMLRSHAEIYLSPLKEVNYFGIRDKETNPCGLTFSEYFNYFLGASEKQLIGEFSPAYLTNIPSLRNLFDKLPNAKIIVTLRDPMERFLSQFKHHYDKHGVQIFDTYVSIALEQYRKGFPNGRNWYLPVKNLYQSLYFEGVDFLMSNFGEEKVIFVKHADLLSNAGGEINRICDFLGVSQIEVENRKTNQSSEKGLDIDIGDKNRLDLRKIFEEDLGKLYDKYKICVA